ncbi:MFS transporter [Caulobacter sp. Root1455]|uniref:MFS transporter n=1 Tax=unclassified Caulobacter TaxID=2648921 RepID=UPI0006F424F7|nr:MULTISPECIES: MFS transporter [unclassified Caulobacter]KQY32972.1 MFS transporter [Caulobacter sp. Root487D2Y]KQZ02647.1 MFS transporter [Caulobacter sp. Root1455]
MRALGSDARAWWCEVTRYQWFVFAIVSGAWLFDTLDQRIFSLSRIAALSNLMGAPGTDLAVQAMAKSATAIFLIGWGVGGLVIGALGDRFGRSRLLLASVALYSVCSGATAMVTTADAFAALRLLTGIGIGGVFGLAVTILSEVVSGQARVAMLALLQVLSTVGNILAAVLKMAADHLVANGHLAQDDVWRVLFFIGALPILICVVGAWRLREPEPWRRLQVAGQLPKGALGAFIELFRSREDRRNLVIGSLLSIAGVVGLWAIGEFAVDLQDAVFTLHFQKNHPAQAVRALVADAKNWAYFLQMVGGALGMMVFGYAANRIGRRPAFIIAFAGAFVVTVMVYWKLQTPLDAYWMMPLMGAFQLGVFAGFSIYLPELFGGRVRGTGVSVAYNLGRFAAAAGGFGSAFLTTRVFGHIEGPDALRYSAMLMCSIFLIGILAAWRAPETRGAEYRD